MPSNRRAFIKISLSSAYISLLGTDFLSAAEKEAAQAIENIVSPLTDAMQKFHHAAEITLSDAITLKLPRNVENGAVVPITVNTDLPDVREITLWVAKNPTPRVATFKLAPTMAAFISARIRIAETCNVIAVVNSAGKFYKARQEVIVTLGGCGG